MRLALALCSLIAMPAVGQNACTSCNRDSARFDTASGLCLPSTIDGFETATSTDASVSAAKKYRNTLYAGYYGFRNSLTITAYLYDRDSKTDAADANELRSSVAEIMAAHQGALIEGAGKTTLMLAGRAAQADSRVFMWRDQGDDHASFLWLVPQGSRYLKVRATYIRPHSGTGEAMQHAIESVRTVVDNICSSR